MACFGCKALMLASVIAMTGAIRVKEAPDMHLDLTGLSEKQIADLQVGGRYENFPLPASLQNHNIVFMGDSVDRQALEYLCRTYAKTAHYNHNPLRAADGPAGDKFNHERLRAGSEILAVTCRLPTRNTEVLYLFHQGVLSVEPEAFWHHLRNGREKMYPKTEKTNTTVSSALDMVKTYWKPAIE